MIGKSKQEYVFIRISIALLRLIAPASIGYLLASIYARRFLVSPWFAAYPIAEASFYLLVYLPRRALLQRVAKHRLPLDRTERQVLFEKCLSHSAGDTYPYGWFLSTDIKRENVIDWIYWALFSCERADATPEWQMEADGYLALIEQRIGKRLEDGRNEVAKSMRLTLDPVVMVHRPLLWYGIVACVDSYTSVLLHSNGFKHYASRKWFRVFPPRLLTTFSRRSPSPDLSYWYRPHRSVNKLPIVFIHGIGIGLYPYTEFLRRITDSDGEVGILAIELLAISMRMTQPVPGGAAICIAISEILASLKIEQFVLATHSYGTVVAGQLLHSPELGPQIAGMLLMDPIPFLLHLPSVAYNFVYRQPRRANEWQLWYFASRDADVARSLSRHFFWAECVVWKEELEGRPVTVVLSGDDQIVDTEAVRRYLTGEVETSKVWEGDELKVMFYPGLDHATVFDSRARLDELVRAIEDLNRLPLSHVV